MKNSPVSFQYAGWLGHVPISGYNHPPLKPFGITRGMFNGSHVPRKIGSAPPSQVRLQQHVLLRIPTLQGWLVRFQLFDVALDHHGVAQQGEGRRLEGLVAAGGCDHTAVEGGWSGDALWQWCLAARQDWTKQFWNGVLARCCLWRVTRFAKNNCIQLPWLWIAEWPSDKGIGALQASHCFLCHKSLRSHAAETRWRKSYICVDGHPQVPKR